MSRFCVLTNVIFNSDDIVYVHIVVTEALLQTVVVLYPGILHATFPTTSDLSKFVANRSSKQGTQSRSFLIYSYAKKVNKKVVDLHI